ncbi:MAG TPA: hypothetical protein VHA33_05480 [Candidatus Angelobacter sp.]|jgi:hypothetical protein|nr:hypothetical protein [Candidatus Angelobacter sp.]
MPDDNTPDGSKTPDTKTKSPKTLIGGPAPQGGIVVAAGGQEITPAADTALAAGAAAPIGGITLDVGTDVTNQLNQAIPAFGNLLTAIGNGVGASQQALDQGVIQTVNTLNNTNIEVLTEVVDVLNDDGLPDASKTQLVTETVSVLNFFSPTVHEWKNVSISMDLEVGSFHQDQGLQFSQSQHKEEVTATSSFWGFLGWFDTDVSYGSQSKTVNTTQEVQWQQGQIRVDALLGPRNTGKFPVPDSVTIGPQIFISLGAVVETKTGDVVTARAMDIQIEVRKADGSPNPTKPIVLDAGGLLPSFTGGTSSTDANGKLKATLTRNLSGSAGFTKFPVTASLGLLRKPFTITL